MKIGIVLKETTSRSGSKKSDLHQLLIYEKFASEIIVHFSKHKDIEVILIKKSLIDSIITTVDKDHFDILIALGCINDEQYIIYGGVQVKYNHHSVARRGAEIFQNLLVNSTKLKDLGIIQKGQGKGRDSEGLVMEKLAIPCIIANPFPSETGEELQQLMHNYKNIFNSYVLAITNTIALL